MFDKCENRLLAELDPTDYALVRPHLRGGFEISCQACSSSSKALASFRSRVSKPSVNQP